MDCCNHWYYRRDRVIALIEEYSPDLLGVQEATPPQMSDLRKDLSQYKAYGVGRDDGQNRGEYSAIFYRRERYKQLDQGTFWLSENYHQPGSTGWDASCPRICSWIKLEDRSIVKELYIFNTHIDHEGRRAQHESAKLILSQMKEIAGLSAPILLTGDFNSKPDEDPYQTVVSNTPFQDAKILNEAEFSGPVGTWSTYKVKHGANIQLDFIFVTRELLRVLNYQHVTYHTGASYPSDHLPVLAKLAFK